MARTVTNLAIIFDQEISFNDQINQLCRSLAGMSLNYYRRKKSSQVLHSSSLELLATPTSRTKTYGDRAFSVCAPKLWTGLRNNIRNVGTLPLFKGI